MRFDVISDQLDTLLLRSFDIDLFDPADIKYPDTSAYDINFSTKQSCINNIETGMKQLEQLKKPIDNAIFSSDPAALCSVSCELGLITLNLYYSVLQICNKN